MLTADRAVETLVEKFAVTCSNEYSLKTDRSSEIIDYVLGTTDKFPDMLGNSSHYVYQTIDLLMKLAKKDDGDIFYRARGYCDISGIQLFQKKFMENGCLYCLYGK